MKRECLLNPGTDHSKKDIKGKKRESDGSEGSVPKKSKE
jgi:hypothetical protein